MEDCSVGAATNDTEFGLHQFQYNNSKVLQKVKKHLEETNFTGITVDRIIFIATNNNILEIITEHQHYYIIHRGRLHLIILMVYA